jgi:nucleoside-diphosphate-sugar epimerase
MKTHDDERVLVTGGTGTLGQSLVAQLAAGFVRVVLSLSEPDASMRKRGVDWLRTDYCAGDLDLTAANATRLTHATTIPPMAPSDTTTPSTSTGHVR